MARITDQAALTRAAARKSAAAIASTAHDRTAAPANIKNVAGVASRTGTVSRTSKTYEEAGKEIFEQKIQEYIKRNNLPANWRPRDDQHGGAEGRLIAQWKKESEDWVKRRKDRTGGKTTQSSIVEDTLRMMGFGGSGSKRHGRTGETSADNPFGPGSKDLEDIDAISKILQTQGALGTADRASYEGQYKSLQTDPQLQQQREIAMGLQPTAAELAARAQQGQVGQNIAAQASAAQGGAYNPAVARAALAQQAGLGQQMAGVNAANISAERQNAMQNVIANQMSLLGAAQGQQRYGMALDSQNFGQVMAQQQLLEDLRTGRIGNKLSEFNARLEPARIAMGYQQLSEQGRQFDLTRKDANSTWNKYIKPISGMVIEGAGAALL